MSEYPGFNVDFTDLLQLFVDESVERLEWARISFMAPSWSSNSRFVMPPAPCGK